MLQHFKSSLLAFLFLGMQVSAQGPGTVIAAQEISDTEGGFIGVLDNLDHFGFSVSQLSDLNGDGIDELAVGAPRDDDGGPDRGAVWILFLNSSGSVVSHKKISSIDGGFTAALDDEDLFGMSAASLGDLDGDGVGDLAVGSLWDDDGGADRGCVWILFLNSDGTVKSHSKVSSTEGGFLGSLDDGDGFGRSVSRLEDLDGDGVCELAVGAYLDDDGGTGHGAVWILFLRNDGTVKTHQKISSLHGGFVGILDDNDAFGNSLCQLGDLNSDGYTDLAVGSSNDDDAGPSTGSVWILFLDAQGSVQSHQRISATEGGFGGSLDFFDAFGSSCTALGDIDGDGVVDLGVGAWFDDDGGSASGAMWVLMLKQDGTIKCHQKLSELEGGLGGALQQGDTFGVASSAISDLNGDGVPELAVGTCHSELPSVGRGAVWVLFLNAGSPASSSVRNGAGSNPLGFSEVSSAIVGSTWNTTVDIVTPGAVASAVAISTGGPLPGFMTAFGELLCAPPFVPSDVSLGSHSILIPCDATLIGAALCTQALVIKLAPFELQFNNSIDIVIGTY